jgi:hypothetical protein
MNRRNFIKNTTLFGSALLLPSYMNSSIFTYEDEGINYPGLNEFIKEEESKLVKNSDFERHFRNQFEAIKKDPTQTKRVQQVLTNFNGTRFDKQNGLINRTVNHNIKKAMNDRGRYSKTPVFTHKSNFVNFDDFSINEGHCDISQKTLTNLQSLFVFAMDGRGTDAFEVDYNLTHLMLNPKWYCLGLPSDFPQTVYLTETDKKNIYLKTNLSTYRTSYNFQSFSYRGSSICGDAGLEDGPKNTNIYYNVDDAISQYLGLTSIEACGDPKDLKCKLKV